MARRKQFTDDEKISFAMVSNPHQWFLVADHFHEQAIELNNNRNHSFLIYSENSRKIFWDHGNKSKFLLCSLALENALKSFLVYEHPHWVSEGCLNKELRTHKLTDLASKSSLIPYANRDRWLLEVFQNGNESWMRYPAGIDADDMKSEWNMPQSLWSSYARVMSGYGTRLTRLLRAGWKSPYEGRVKWDIYGSWLGGKGPPIPENLR